jgi:hypothetical protein
MKVLNRETVHYLYDAITQPTRLVLNTKFFFDGVRKPKPVYSELDLAALCVYLKQSKINSIHITNASVLPLCFLGPIIESMEHAELIISGPHCHLLSDAIEYLIKEMPRFTSLAFDDLATNKEVIKKLEKLIQALPNHPNVTGFRLKNTVFTNKLYRTLINVLPRTRIERLDIGEDSRDSLKINPGLTTQLLDVVHQRKHMSFFAAPGLIEKEHVEKFIQIVRDLPIVEVRRACLREFVSWDLVELAKAAGQNCRLQAIHFGRVFVPVARMIVRHLGFHPTLAPEGIFTLEYAIAPVLTDEELEERTWLLKHTERINQSEYRVLSTLLSAVTVARIGVKSPVRVLRETNLFRLLKEMLV